MIEHYFIAIIYIGGFMGLAAIAEGIFKLCDYISDRRIRDKPIEDKPLSDSVRQIKIKPQRPAYIEMIKNEYADDAEPVSKSQRIKVGI